MHSLVYYEQIYSKEAALIRKKQLKKWKRAWQVEQIESVNSEWNDLSPFFCD
jgi:putative endonuclease